MKKGVPIAAIAVVVLAALVFWLWNRPSIKSEESVGPIRVRPVVISMITDPDDFVTVVFTLANLSDQRRSYQLQVTAPEGWHILDLAEAIELSGNAQQEIFLTARTPPATPPGRYVLSLRAQSDSDFGTGRMEIRVRTAERIKLIAPPAQPLVRPGEEKPYPITVMNRGNVQTTVHFAVTLSPLGWQFRLPPPLILLPGESRVVEVMLHPLSQAATAPAQMKLEATAGKARDEISFTVVLSPD